MKMVDDHRRKGLFQDPRRGHPLFPVPGVLGLDRPGVAFSGGRRSIPGTWGKGPPTSGTGMTEGLFVGSASASEAADAIKT